MSKTILNKSCVFFLCIYLVSRAFANVPETRSARRLHIPLLGLGPRCTGCPPRYCDDDPAIIHGYCCGCARLFDSLPVKCAPQLRCPANNYELCEQYEYMVHCCC